MLVGKDGKAHVPDPVERRANALAALKLICESQVFFPHLELLLATQDAQGIFFFRVFECGSPPPPPPFKLGFLLPSVDVYVVIYFFSGRALGALQTTLFTRNLKGAGRGCPNLVRKSRK